VQAGGVIPADVLDDGELELASRSLHAVSDQLGLEAVDERLGQRVVVGITDRSDGRELPDEVFPMLGGDIGSCHHQVHTRTVGNDVRIDAYLHRRAQTIPEASCATRTGANGRRAL
jgi:hypothetical protein